MLAYHLITHTIKNSVQSLTNNSQAIGYSDVCDKLFPLFYKLLFVDYHILGNVRGIRIARMNEQAVKPAFKGFKNN